MKINIIWFRRDLRLHDHTALYHALKSKLPVLPVFIFDKNILDTLEEKSDTRVTFIYNAIQKLQQQLIAIGSNLEVFYGYPAEVLSQLCAKYEVDTIFFNHDYEPYARERDEFVGKQLAEKGINVKSYKDHVVFEKEEVVKDDGKPYTVFTPYSRKWKAKLAGLPVTTYPTEKYFDQLYRQPAKDIVSLQQIGFQETSIPFPAGVIDDVIIRHYSESRDFPSKENGTSHMGVHLRFGTVSIRQLVQHAVRLNDTYLNELIWRDFYQMILWHFPQVGKGKSFKPEYDLIRWRNDETEFQRWCDGMTGYPIVDAGMRELNATGYMHNRVRMITASFLTKHLLIDWRWGEAYFAQKLLDFDLASNNGGWQWAAGSGCDAAPYFRVFNPYLQTQKFDKDLVYIRKWVPELDSFTYPKPIVPHEIARERVLRVYKEALQSK